MNVFVNNSVERFKMRDNLLRYLKEEWQIGYNPNLDRTKHDLKAFDLRSQAYFYEALNWLVEQEYALVKICENDVERILMHPLYELKMYFVTVDPVE